ncbi:hypothetical protein QYM36_008558 [Artemia franciscana]|uniref:Uncharacterized protein n=1 Tax=Artemia franciscana TaxID=6661 RepID=A0AA88LE34_ARTSF|nr:hypothetical protein QYM36_008558 [Artemia franciscana]
MEGVEATKRLTTKRQTLDDAYAEPSNFLEIDLSNPVTHPATAGKKKFTDYEVRTKESSGKMHLSIKCMYKLPKRRMYPCFVIFNPFETSVINGAVSATLATKVNKITQKLDGFIDVTIKCDLFVCCKVNNATTSAIYNFQSIKPLYAVVLKNCPQDIRDPHDHKQFIDSICKEASNDIKDLKGSSNNWNISVHFKQK